MPSRPPSGSAIASDAVAQLDVLGWASSLHLLVLSALTSACGGGEFAIPETREEQLAMLDEKQREERKIRSEITQLERAIGGDSTAVVDAKLVAASPIVLGDFEREIELQATVESDETGVVTVEVPGRVSQVMVREGQSVRRGQALLRIEQESLGIQLADLQANLGLAKDLAARQQRLRAQDIGTEVQLLEANNAVERLEKQIDQLRVQQGKSLVTAPISGTIENKMINPGELATPGMPLMQILDAATVKVVADVPETYLKAVKKGQTVRVEFPSINETRRARVTDIGRTIDAANRTFRIELDMPNANRLLKPNLLANVYLVDYAKANVVTVPSETILEETDGREYVFVAEPVTGQSDTYTAKKVYVTTGENDATKREVTSGLNAGDLLVNKGMRSIAADQSLRIEGLSPKPNTTPQPTAAAPTQ